MKIIIAFALALGLLSCTEDNKSNAPAEIVGKWRLIELYSDPGDGSGEFAPVESDKIIIFSSKGIYVSNSSICRLGATTGEVSTGPYNWAERVLIPKNCEFGDRNISYEIQESHLILYYPCIEGCAEKYVKIEG